MADYQGAVPVQTVRDDEFKIKIVDFASGGTATAGLKIEADGSVNTNSKITDGTNNLVINDDGSVNVRIDDGTEVFFYDTDVAVPSGNTVTYDLVATNTKTLEVSLVTVGARGAVKVEVSKWDGTTATPVKTWFQQPAVNTAMAFQSITIVGDGTNALRVVITNQDKSASDVYCSIEGVEA